MLEALRFQLKYLFRQRPIIQFGPGRSGSTLMYNFIREAVPGREILKLHNISPALCRNNQVVVTYRNPFDSVASSIQRYRKDQPDEAVVRKHIELIKGSGMDDLLRIFDMPGLLKLQYERFYNDFDYAFDQLEGYFALRIEPATRERLKRELNVDRIDQTVKQQFDKFIEYDPVTLWHGNHVSVYRGVPGSYKLYFSEEQIGMIADAFREHLDKLGYSG